jgi:hypothetical protein
MSVNTQFTILLAFILAEMIGIVIYAVVSSEWFARHFADKIENATIHVWNGKGYEPVRGKLFDTELWEVYRYKIYGSYHTVDLQPDYPVVYEKRRRVIFARIGKAWADSIPGLDPVRYSETDNARSMCTESVKEAFKAIKKKGLQITPVMLILIGLIVVAVAVGGWYYTSHNKKTAATKQPVIITTTQAR